MAKPRPKSKEDVPLTSSTPRRLPRKQETLFREVLQLLESRRIPFSVSGAFALQQHTGICRDTKDLDLFLCVRDASPALACLQEQGFECEVADPVWLAKAHRDSYFVDLITGMSNGVITVDASWIRHSVPARLMGVNTRVLAPEELVISKLFVTRRERFDGADIAHVIYATRGKLDWDRLLRQLGEHWEILLWALQLFRYVYPGQSGYVPSRLWKDLMGRLKSALAHPNPNDVFRGSLIDEFMFAIDLKEWGLRNVLSEYRARAPKIRMAKLASCV
ncbi:MAG TPA: nucleotidyltransferase [Terriglobales bacterium]